MVLFEIFVYYGMTGLFAIGILSSIIPIPTEPVVLGLLDIGKNPESVFVVLITGSILGLPWDICWKVRTQEIHSLP